MKMLTEVEVARCYQSETGAVTAVDLCLMYDDGSTSEQYVEIVR